MHLVDATVLVAIVTALGVLAGALANTIGGKSQKVIDLISERLNAAEHRLDVLERELAVERQRRMTLAVYATAIRAWAKRAWDTLVANDIEFDSPPTWSPESAEEQALLPDIEKEHTINVRKKKDTEG